MSDYISSNVSNQRLTSNLYIQTKKGIPENNVEDIPRPFRGLSIRLRRVDTWCLLSIEQTPVHSLIHARTFGRNDFPSGSRPLGGLPIHTTGDIFTTDSKVSSSDIGLVSAMEFLRQLVGAGLETKVVIGRLTDGIGRFVA